MLMHTSARTTPLSDDGSLIFELDIRPLDNFTVIIEDPLITAAVPPSSAEFCMMPELQTI